MAFFGTSNIQNSKNDLEMAKKKITELVNLHMESLVSKRTRGIKVSSSGLVDSSAWNKVAQTFINKTIVPHLTTTEGNAILSYGLSRFATEFIEKPVQWQSQLKKWKSNSLKIENPSGPMTPLEYEEYCAKLITKEGWMCASTKYTGDQGADVVAKKNGKTLVVQCKLYNGSVGNAAVQEVIAAKSFYRADHAAVVTNSTYTKSAIELGTSAGVILLNHDEIIEINRRIQLSI